MANLIRMRPGLSPDAYNRLRKEIRDRVDGCWTDSCWTLKDENDKGQIYLEKEMVRGGHGRYVQIRRYLFLISWGTIPDRRKLIPLCKNPPGIHCVHPGHMTYKGFKPPYDMVTEFIHAHWLTEEDVKKWYGG